MASDRPSDRNPSTAQSIPLQDLSRSPHYGNGQRARNNHQRNISGRARALLGNRQSFSGLVNTGRYQRVSEGSPTASDRNQLELPHVTTPRNAHQPSYPRYEDGELSPMHLEEQSAFQAAMGSVGLTFEAPESSKPQGINPSPSRPRSSVASLDVSTTKATVDSISPPTPPTKDTADYNDDYFSPIDSDQIPLTDERYLQPIGGASTTKPVERQNNRYSTSSVRLEGGMPSGSRLGDDLHSAEAGLRRSASSTMNRLSSFSARSATKSLSPSAASSPLLRAGTMVRKMSQRVVNLSNEPELIEQSIRRQASGKQARLEGPPSFPAMPDFTHDEPVMSLPPIEKAPHLDQASTVTQRELQQDSNPLKGRSVGLFGPNDRIRRFLCEILVHPATEPVILILIVVQTVLLAVANASPLGYNGRETRHWGSSWIDYAIAGLFVVYTIEIGARIIVSGFIRNAPEYSNLDTHLGPAKSFTKKFLNLLSQDQQSSTGLTTDSDIQQPSILRSLTSLQLQTDQPGNSRQQQRIRLARRAFLRHSFNRLDFLAVVSFWIAFVLSFTKIESVKHVYVFEMLSSLRILRLLSLTSGTSVILRSLKKAAPLLVNVAFLIGFFWLLFAIIGVQSFKSSLRRTCVWIDPSGNISNNYDQNFAPSNIQFCGGYLDNVTGEEKPWLRRDLTPNDITSSHKGFLCPQGSLCVESDNPYNGTVSFDNVPQSLQLVFVIMSSNGFSDLMYYTTETDYLAAALFFASGIVIMSFWLMNLLVAVITSSFQVIREESKTSAFTIDELPQTEDEEEPARVRPLKRVFDRTYWFWVLVIAFGLVTQCLRAADMTPAREAYITNTETVVTLILAFEIFLRFIADWRRFHKSPRNWVDLGLAVVTAVIQLPQIRDSGQPYAWMSIFQIVRIYRIVLAVSLTRDLILKVLGNFTGILNLIVFVLLITFLTAIFAVQIFRGEFPPYDEQSAPVHISFMDTWNSFLGMYQILSSENWTILMFNATQYETHLNTAWIGAAFFIIWFILANFIVLNMFIAVIQENFDVTEDEKRLHQVRAFLQQKELGGSSHGNLSLSTIFNLGRNSQRHRSPLDYGPSTMEMLLKDAVVRDFLDEQIGPKVPLKTDERDKSSPEAEQVQPGALSAIWGKLVALVQHKDPNPFYSRLQFSRAYEALDPRTMASQVISATEQRKRAQREYLVKHPAYNKSLFLFGPSNPIRRFCQHIVGPGRGIQRIEGVEPIKAIWYTFSAFIYAAIVALVLLACVTTPLYEREYFSVHGSGVRNWFVWTDLGFAVLFAIEALIKIVADGFFWTPNAFFRSTWGFIDGLVLVTLWINVVTSLRKDGTVSRAVGAFKALRALRLLNVSDSARDTFHSVIILGGWKVLSASFVSLSFLIPFAIYGLNLFNGRMLQCNDSINSSIENLSDCVDEYVSTPYNWGVLAPRQVANPYYSFDNFGSSLFILFQIVSQEGWTDVMWTAMSSVGKGLQLKPNASQGNAVFFIVFNLLGAVFVLTLFVSVFMRNYTEQTGVAFLTAEQRSWLELRKLLRQISPSKRPALKSDQRWSTWCYRLAVKKHGRWQRFITTMLFLHLILLVLEVYPEVPWWERTRDYLFLGLIMFYMVNIIIRIVGLTWNRFCNSSWDLYSLFSVGGAFITTLLAIADTADSVYVTVHKLFLVSIALLLIPRNNQLDQLFKTAAASFTAIANLLATWFVLFLVYAIALTQTFGLTRFGSQENGNLNFRTVPKALIVLFRISIGEGWNQIMEDFATITPPQCVTSDNFYDSDCGSGTWARVLFISWNILSMYIFVSLFVSLIFESFSYVYQRSSGLSAVSRDEIRRFKQAWATFDPKGTGYITRENFPRLLGELSGVFEMRIYEGEHTVHRILEDCTVDVRGLDSPPPGVVDGIDLAKLSKRASSINVLEVKRRRERMELFYQEVLVSADADRGINFTSCLMILAHYNVISDSKSLRLEEFLRRRARLQRVEEEIKRSVVRGFFDMQYWSRQFKRRRDARDSARMMAPPNFNVPEINIFDQDGQSPIHHQYSTSPRIPTIQFPDEQGSGTNENQQNSLGLRRRGDSTGSSPSRTEPGTTRPGLDPSRPSISQRGDYSPYDGTISPSDGLSSVDGGRSRAGSSIEVDRQNVLDVFDNSAWGESIRRSFTLNRHGTRGKGSRSDR